MRISDWSSDVCSSDLSAVDQPDTGDPAEDAYLVGYRLWDAGRFAGAQKALEAMAKEHPDHRRASYARNLAGRAALDDGKPATAAKILLANYQDDPRSEEHTSELQSLMRTSYAVFCLKKKK